MCGFYRDLKDVKWDKKPYVDTWCSHWPRSVLNTGYRQEILCGLDQTLARALALVSLWPRGETLDLRGVEIGKKLRSALNQTLEGDRRVGGHCLFIECMGQRFCSQVNNLLLPIINKMSIRSIL